MKERMKKFSSDFKLMFTLAKSDFRKRFVGSFFGIIWMIIQPCVTVIIYYVIFEKGMGRGGMGIEWLLAGLAPWFFFSEALSAATESLFHYSYLVKKVVFKVNILPQVKIFSAGFVHVIFICIVMVVCIIKGIYPSVYWIQAVYFSFAAYVLVSGLSYATTAISVFFKDMIQIVNIITQIGLWLTPIMWPIEPGTGLSSFIFSLNPMYYVVEGYRSAFVRNEWFWNSGYTINGSALMHTLYFWGVALICLWIGTKIFKKLKPHFADIL